MKSELSAYLRADGRWGVRNHVLALPVHAAACSVCAEIAARVPGVVTVRHDWTGGDGPDEERALRTFVGHAAHPNVGAVLVVGLDDGDVRVADAALARGQCVEFVSLAGSGGSQQAADDGVERCRALVRRAAVVERTPAPPAALHLGLECGGSDAMSGITANPALGIASDLLVEDGGTAILAETSELIGAEHLLAARAVSREIAADLLAMIDRFERDVATLGVDLRGGQPVPGNIAGGLTTIEEKSLGAAKKGGSAPIEGVLDFGEEPDGHGLYVMDTPGNDIEQMVGMVAGGVNVIAFTTGRGTPTGSPIAPCLKISTTTALFERMRDDIDLDAGTILGGGETLREVGERILVALFEVAGGRPTAAERHGDHEFAVSRLQAG